MNPTNNRLRIAVLGTGAIGGFYGLLLARAGHEVHFLLRSDYDCARAQGLLLKSAKFSDFHLQGAYAYREVRDIPPCDCVLMATKTTSNADIAPIVAQVAAQGARVLLLQNGLSGEDVFRRHLPADVHLLGALCMVSVHRVQPGIYQHFGLGGINLGYHSGPIPDLIGQHQVVEAVCQLFSAAGLDALMMENLLQARWQKLMFDIPFNGVSVLLNSGFQGLMTNVHARQLVLDLMEEVLAGSWPAGLHRLRALWSLRSRPMMSSRISFPACWTTTAQDGRWNWRPFMQSRWQRRRALGTS